MRILVTTPLLSVPPRGACEHDRVAGIRQLVRLGHEVRTLSFAAPWQTLEEQRRFAATLGAPIEFIEYRPQPPSFRSAGRRLAAAARRLALLDGSALVYSQPQVLQAFDRALRDVRPDVAWFDYTNLWPLLERARSHGVRTVMRSLNYEPKHNLDERGASLVNRFRYFSKYLSERTSMRQANAFAAITPADRRHYLRLGRTDCVVLPLRSLAGLLRPVRPARARPPIEAFFFGSNFAVSHNRAALLFILDRLVPALRREAPGAFRFHVLGAKVPPDLSARQADDLRLHGFVEDLDEFLEDMDVAVIPSLYGGGMQQKIFEPICRAFPTVVSPRGLAGYLPRDGEHALLAADLDDFVAALLRLHDPNERARLSRGAAAFAADHFNQPALDRSVEGILKSAIGGPAARCA